MTTTEYSDYVTAAYFLKNAPELDDIYVKDSDVDLLPSNIIHNFTVACRAMLDVSYVDFGCEKVVFDLGNEDCCTFVIDNLKDRVCLELDGSKLICRGANILEVYDVLYKDASIYKRVNRDYFLKMAYGVGPYDELPFFRFCKTLPNAVPPKKNKSSDSGFDLVLVQKGHTIGNVTYYDTGIQIAPPLGWYFDLVGRSSISKTGHMLANNIGIIDQSYRGNILVALVKLSPDVPDIELPARLVQIIPRKVWHMEAFECAFIEHTARGNGGFGSSGK